MVAKTYLDGVLIENPDGINKLEHEMFYDDELKGMFLKVNNDLSFHSDGYDYLEDLVFNQGVCNTVEFLLYVGGDTLKRYFEGVIHLVDTELNVSREILKTPVSDNNASAYVFNNKNVKAYLGAAKQKSGGVGRTITTVTLDYFTPSTGLYDYSRDNNVTVDEAFAFLIDFVSDGQMTYSSPLFGAGGDKEGLFLVNARHLSDNLDVNPYLSFYELFTEMDKLYDISFRIDYSGALPEMIIDLTDNLYTDTDLMTFSDIKDVTFNFDKERFYSVLDIGSNTTQSYMAGTFTMPDANFLGFSKEKYYMTGQCNLDRTLNLVNDFIIDSNVIEDLLVNGNQQYEEAVVIVETDNPGTAQATKYDNIITGGTFIYNKGLNNYSKSVNYLGAIPNDIVLFITNDANNFEATKSAYNLGTGVIIHNTEVSDPGSNYDPVLGRFTAPVAGEGAYSFTYSYTGKTYTGSLGGDAGTVTLKHYNSADVLLESIVLIDFTITVVIIDFGGATAAFSLEAGDYVTVEGTAGLSGTVSFSGTDFKGAYIDVEGGTYQTYDPNDYKVMAISFEAPLTFDEFENIRDNITQRITVESGVKRYKGWIRSMKRNILSGMTQIKLRTSNNLRV